MNHRLRVAIRTVGCRANQADSGTLARSLDAGRIEIVSEISCADLTVINTCCVTAEAERDCRKMARRVLRDSPGSRVVLTGCAVSAIDGFGSDIEGDVAILGGGDTPFVDIAGAINLMANDVELVEVYASPESTGRTRALLKVQNGCEHRCAYCIVPEARGPERSMPLAQVFDEVDRIAETGTGEIVLTGVQIGAWGSDLPGEPGLHQLLAAVADRFSPGRMRLSSVEPWSADEALIDVIAGHPRVCPHLHVPLQSGDDSVLARMRRGYTVADYCARIELARERVDDLFFGTDVICGFPGEDEAAFSNTLDVIRRLAPAQVHAFPYSPRPGTPAFDMESVGREVAKGRVRQVIDIAEPFSRSFRERQVGKTRQVIVEQVGERARGITDNFVPVELPAGAAMPGELVACEISCLLENGLLRGTVVGSSLDVKPKSR